MKMRILNLISVNEAQVVGRASRLVRRSCSSEDGRERVPPPPPTNQAVGRASQRERVPHHSTTIHGLSERSPSYNDPFSRILPKTYGVFAHLRNLLLFFLLSSSMAFASDAFQKGIDAYHDSEYAEASDAFKEAVTDSETAAAHHNLALALYQVGKVSESAWHLERAVLLDPLNEQYQFKLGALRQQLGLITARPEWYEIAIQALSQQGWIILLSIAFWITLAGFCLPKFAGYRPPLQIKALRIVGLIVVFLASSALYLNRHLAHQGIVLSETPATLHAAPASAAPQVGLARPGERGQVVDQYGDYLEIETEGGARGWIESEQFRTVQLQCVPL